MKNLRTNSIYTLIVLSFAIAIAIIEFIHYNNQTWHTIACCFLFPLLALLITVFVTTFIFALCLDKQSIQPHKGQKTEAQENNSRQSKGGNTDTQDTAKQAAPERKQDKKSENQPMQTTPTMQECKVSYKSTFVEYTASNSGNYHRSTNEADEETEEIDKGEQTS